MPIKYSYQRNNEVYTVGLGLYSEHSFFVLRALKYVMNTLSVDNPVLWWAKTYGISWFEMTNTSEIKFCVDNNQNLKYYRGERPMPDFPLQACSFFTQLTNFFVTYNTEDLDILSGNEFYYKSDAKKTAKEKQERRKYFGTDVLHVVEHGKTVGDFNTEILFNLKDDPNLQGSAVVRTTLGFIACLYEYFGGELSRQQLIDKYGQDIVDRMIGTPMDPFGQAAFPVYIEEKKKIVARMKTKVELIFDEELEAIRQIHATFVQKRAELRPKLAELLKELDEKYKDVIIAGIEGDLTKSDLNEIWCTGTSGSNSHFGRTFSKLKSDFKNGK